MCLNDEQIWIVRHWFTLDESINIVANVAGVDDADVWLRVRRSKLSGPWFQSIGNRFFYEPDGLSAYADNLRESRIAWEAAERAEEEAEAAA